MKNKTLQQAMTVVNTVRRQLAHAQVIDLDHMAERRAHLAQRMQRLVQMAELLSRAARARYCGAARRLQRRYDWQLTELLSEIQHHRATSHLDGRPETPRPTPRQILEELDQLEAEFGGWRLEHPSQSLTVDTDPVILEGIALGRFRISLELKSLAGGITAQPLLIEALDPNPPAGSDHVTHPHVSDRRLCMGEATTAIGAALRDGRLADCFLLVRNVLNTYNPESPYIALDDWESDPCPDCGERLYGDNRFWCELCDRDYCDQCMGLCHDCNNSTCYGCLSTCDHCEETFCRTCCMRQCAECGESCCPGCLEDDLCPTCHEEKEPHDDHEEQEPPEMQATQAQATEPAAA